MYAGTIEGAGPRYYRRKRTTATTYLPTTPPLDPRSHLRDHVARKIGTERNLLGTLQKWCAGSIGEARKRRVSPLLVLAPGESMLLADAAVTF